MDAGSFVIALLTAAGAAAGPAAGALPDDGSPGIRCVAAPAADDLDDGAAGATGSRDRSSGAATGLDAEDRALLVEEAALELAELVAGSDDPTDRRLAAALLAAGFEPGAGSAPDRAQENAVDRRVDDELAGSGSPQGRDAQQSRDEQQGRDEQLDDGRLADDLGAGQASRDDRLLDQDRGQDRGDDRLARDDATACSDGAADGAAGRAADGDDALGRTGQASDGTDRRTDLDDVLARSGDRREADRAPDSTDIAAALEREQGAG